MCDTFKTGASFLALCKQNVLDNLNHSFADILSVEIDIVMIPS